MFCKYVNSHIAYRKPIGTLIDDSGNAVVSDQSKADMFNIYYSSTGITDNGYRYIPACDVVVVNSILETVRFTETDVIHDINKLKTNLSSGPHMLPPLLFKESKHS